MGDTGKAIKEPKYWGSWKGRIATAIALDGEQTWNELLEKTGLTEATLNKVLAEMFSDKTLQKTNEGKYRIGPELYKEYRAFLEKKENLKDSGKEKTHMRGKFSEGRKTELVDWINQWKVVKKLDFSLEPKHFFLEGRHLDDLSKELICNATSEVLVVNPYVSDCDLSDTLWQTSSRGKKVRLVTRPPEDEKEEHRKKKQDYHTTLKKEGVLLTYNKRAHAKLIVVDRAVAIASSMNFYSGYSGGESWEAGLISIEDAVVESVVDSILNLLEKPESKELDRSVMQTVKSFYHSLKQ